MLPFPCIGSLTRAGFDAMMSPSAIQERYARWVEAAAETVVGLSTRFSTRQMLVLKEGDEGVLTPAPGVLPASAVARPQLRINDDSVETVATASDPSALAGHDVELILSSMRFSVRSLELPARAEKFLEGIIKAQIDRLTPWSAAQAAFGWSVGLPAGGDRIHVSVAAAPRESLKGYVQPLIALGANSVTILTNVAADDSPQAVVRVFEERA